MNCFLFTIKKKDIKGKHVAENLPKPFKVKKELAQTKIPKLVELSLKAPTSHSLKSNPPPDYSPGTPLEFSKWMSTRQLLEEFPVSARSLYNWRKKKLIPYIFLRENFFMIARLLREY